MTASIAALFRYPIKGFAPERRNTAQLEVGRAFPGDRLFAVEDGPSGFDPAAPAWVTKQKFTVLAKYEEVARAHTRYDDETGVLAASAAGQPDFSASVSDEAGRAAFCAWLSPLLAQRTDRPLRTIDGAGHRFLDHPLGHVSVLNLASVRDLGERLGTTLDPLRFRANIHVEGWPAWQELEWEGRGLNLGSAHTTVFKPIVRCAAPGVDPATAVRDVDIPAELHRLYGHLHMGIYVQVTAVGTVSESDPMSPAQ